MNEALLYICSRAFSNARERPEQQRVLSCLLEDPRLLPWYTQELLRNIRDEIVSAAQVGAGRSARAGRTQHCPPCVHPALRTAAGTRHATQGARDTFRGHWVSLGNPLFHWLELRQEVAGAIAAQPKLQGV